MGICSQSEAVQMYIKVIPIDWARRADTGNDLYFHLKWPEQLPRILLEWSKKIAKLVWWVVYEFSKRL